MVSFINRGIDTPALINMANFIPSGQAILAVSSQKLDAKGASG